MDDVNIFDPTVILAKQEVIAERTDVTENKCVSGMITGQMIKTAYEPVSGAPGQASNLA